MSNFLFYLTAFLVVLGVLIVFHELGHFLVARWCGVKVLRFSLGFGRILWSRKYGKDQTEWAVSVFPLGGYVKMLDEREGDVAANEVHRAFNRQGVGVRSLIVAAGPLANFFLAILLYWAVFMLGSEELLPILGAPPEDTPAAMASIRNGEQVRKIDGETVGTWNDFRWRVLQKAAEQESVELETVDEQGYVAIRRLYLNVVAETGWEGDGFERLGLRGYRPELPAVIGKLVAGGPGDRAGLLPGDLVVGIDGSPVRHWMDLVGAVRKSPGRELRVEYVRDGVTAAVHIVPEAISERGQLIGKIGVAVAEVPGIQRPLKTFVRYGVLEAGYKALNETWEKTVFSVVMFGKMLVGEVSWKNLSGPVTIADFAGQSARLGMDYYLKFMALVSISLGVLNLLPVPVLDGGHLMYHMIEVVRRRPLSERAMEISQQIGLSILFVLMAFAFFNDLNRLFNG